MPLAVGTRLGAYEILSPIGAGGMGEVYRAKDLKLGREVAVKVLLEELAADPERLRRFEQEARAASALNHPNIITIHDVGQEGSTPYIAMELASGISLRELLNAGPIPNRRLLELATQIADGLAKAHTAGIVHRDLKPENLMVTEDGFVKILDFGLAKLTASNPLGDSQLTTAAARTRAGVIVGTVGYMSPEQAKGLAVDYRSDQFSLGLILYEMACGTAAFQGESVAQTLAAIIESEPVPLSELNANAPPGLHRIVARLLSKSTDGRYDSTGDLAKDMRAVRDGAVASNVSTGITAATRKRGLSWMWLAAGVILVLGAVFWLRPSAPAPEQPDSVETDGVQQVIAVLPFDNIAADASQDYFSAGMTEEINNQLSKLASLRVLSRAAVEPYGDARDLSVMASDLGIGSVVTGSVRVAPDRVRVNVQLVDPNSKQTVWSEQYDRNLEDIFEVQSDIALQVVAALNATLSPGEQVRIEARPTENLAAYDLYLRARSVTPRTSAGRQQRLSLLQQAVELDPNFAAAYAHLGMEYARIGAYEVDPTYQQQAIEMARRAIELKPDLAVGHSMLGTIYMIAGRLQDAKVSFLRANELNPNDANALRDHAVTTRLLGRYDEALYWSRRNVLLNPKSSNARWHAALPLIYFDVDAIAERWLSEAEETLEYHARIQWARALLDTRRGRDADAMKRLNDTAERNPEDTEVQRMRARLAVLVRSEDAEALSESLFRSRPDSRTSLFGPSFRTLYATMLWERGENTRANALLDQALAAAEELLAEGNEWPIVPFEVASLHALRGEVEPALEWLERAYQAGWRDNRTLARNLNFESVRDEPRFLELLNRMESDVTEMRRRARERGLLDFEFQQ